MASISTYKGKHGDRYRAIQFVGSDRKRRSIRLGSLPVKDVGDIKERIDLLEVYRKHSQPPDATTAQWLGRIDDAMYSKLADGGLVEPRGDAKKTKGIMLGAWLESYLGQRQALVTAGKLKTRTLSIEQVTRDCLIDHFGAHKLLAELTEGDAETFRHYLLTKGGRPSKRCGSELVIQARKPLSEATTRKRCSIACKMLGVAKRRKLIADNPFDTKAVPRANIATTRSEYVTAADSKAVLDKLPGTQWKLLFALARWGGLRIGETRLLTWAEVLWDEQRLLVVSPKTAHHAGHESRMIPLFPELAELFDKQYSEAAPGEQYVLPMLQGRSDASLRKTIERAAMLAGVKLWTRLWHSLRGTRQNELLETGFKRRAVLEWLGNNSETAHKHYERVTEADWRMANAPDFAPPSKNVRESAAKC